MLEEMRIRALGVIDDAVLRLAPGLTVITGETGAGKTMVVTGLGLLFGGRADSAIVRAEAGAAVIEGRLRVDPAGPAAARAADVGADVDDDVLLVARTISPEGRSRAHVGGRAVPVGVLADLAEHCLAVHGQADQFRLLSPARQREALDRYGGAGVRELADAFAAGYADLRATERTAEELRVNARQRVQEADLLRFGLDEIAAVGPLPDEDVALAAEEDRLAHADALRLAATAAHSVLTGEPDVTGDGPTVDAVSAVAAARASVEHAARHDAALEPLAARLGDIGYALADVAAELGSYAASVDVDPARLSVVQDRRAALGRLTRKYGGPEAGVTEVLAWSAEAVRRVLELESEDDAIAQLEAKAVALRQSLGDAAARLSAQRAAAAQRLANAVTAELRALAMPQARLEVRVSQQESGDGLAVAHGGDRRTLAFGAHGVDDVEILLCPHPGAAARPLARGASGGELSRLMLGIEVVFAGADPVPTMVFDEVDAGVGGKAAVEVGRRLARLARTSQVIVVTHLPQVAAFADRHLVVRKASAGVVTSSDVIELDDQGRVSELSRMFAGRAESQSARAHAVELLDAAARDVAELAPAGR